jgi:diguanylate cyclase (GGDEF)-like protein
MEWRSYESHFKRDEELEYVEYASLEIKATNEYFKNIMRGLVNGESLNNISMERFEKQIEHIHVTISKLINYEVEIAKYERKKFLNIYGSILQNIGIILLLIIFGVLIISYYVFKSIQDDQTKLEIASKKLKKANRKLENASYTDELTSLHNRRYFNFVYDRELKRAKRTKSYITFMMLDIDFFKQYNDTYGHIEGDYALKSVAKVLKDVLKRPSDFVFRLGGEEFGVILTLTEASNSARLAREICDAIRAREIKHEASSVHEYLTISIGVVCCVADESLKEEILISRADEMLYKAKDGGRNGYAITTNVSEAIVQEIDEISEVGA